MRKRPTATRSMSPVVRPASNAAMTHLMISVCHLLIGTGRRWRHRGPISVVA